MRSLFALSALIVSMTSGLATAQAKLILPTCIDPRVTIFAPCSQGEQRYFIGGFCEGLGKVEDSYCAREEMTDFQKYKGQATVALPSGAEDLEHILLADQLVVAKKGVVRNCEHATILMGVSKASAEQANAEVHEIALIPVVLKFQCHDSGK